MGDVLGSTGFHIRVSKLQLGMPVWGQSLCGVSNLSKAVREKAGLPPRRRRSAADGLGLELLQGLFLVLHPDQTYQPPAQDLLPKVQQPWWTDSYRYNL